MPKKIEFNEEEKNKIIEMYETQDISARSLGNMFGASECVILRRLNGWGINTVDYRCHEFSDDDVTEMIRLHQEEKMTQKEICEKFKCSPATVKRNLKKAGISTYRSRRLRFKDKKERAIIDGYACGNSTIKIASAIGCSDTAIRNALARNGVEIKHQGSYRTYDVNDCAFDEINEYSAYFAGLIAADGNLFSGGTNNKKVSIASKDVDVLDKFRAFLGNPDIPITTNKYGVSNVRVSSAKIYDNLNSWGITERKAHTLAIKNDDLLNSRHFWRGFIDGDGSLRISGPYGKVNMRMVLCLAVSSRQVIVDWIRFLLNNGLHANSITRTNKLHRVSYSNSPAERIAQLLYSGASVYMNRKHKVVKDWGILERGGDAI